MCRKDNFELIELHDLGRDTFYTTPLFWDCECEDDFIHSVSENDCLHCGSQREHQPDARVDEVLRYATGLPLDFADRGKPGGAVRPRTDRHPILG